MAAGDLPKYQAIANALRTRIESGALAPGDRLPAQHAMAAEYGVTVMTLRQALARLETEGLVRAAKGRGTFVTEPPTIRFGLDHLWSFAQEMAHQGVSVATDVLGVNHPPVDSVVDDARTVLDDDDLVEIVRRRRIDGTPVVLQRSYVRSSTWTSVDADGLDDRSLYASLAADAGCVLARASEVFRATTLAEPDAILLGSATGVAVMESERTSFDLNDRPFLFDHAMMLGSATEVRAERTADSMRLGYSAR
jgi:GntR family transcriptional regulator